MGGLSSIIDSFTGKSGSSSAREAGRIQSDAALSTLPDIKAAVGEAQAGLDPYTDQGMAFQQQQALLGLLGQDEQQRATEAIQESPSQQFIRKRAERALLRNQAATGGLGGGTTKTALQEQAAGFASQDLENQFNRLAGVTNTGYNAAATRGDIGLRGAEVTGNVVTGAAGARASGVLGGAQARAQGTQNLITTGLGVGALLSDEDRKKDIEELDLKACYDAVISMHLKSWKYLEETGLDQETHLGPMYQEAPEMIKMDGEKMLNLHDELMMIAGAIQYMRKMSCH